MVFPDSAKRLSRRLTIALRSRLLLVVLACCLCAALAAFLIPRGSAHEPLRPKSSVRDRRPAVQAESAIMLEARSGTVLWAKASDRRLPPASCTKIMTALIVLERVHNLQLYATVPQIHLPQTVGIGLLPGERITIEQALRALMVKSANDAALTLAAYVAGDEPSFVRLMNARARELGLSRTHFENSRGTTSPEHLSSARDLATLGRFAMQDARFRKLAGLSTATIRWPPANAVVVTSHNRLLNYPWGTGVKTGATAEAGAVLVGSGRPGLVPLIVVTMREPSRDQEVSDAIGLFAWGSAQYARTTLVSPGEVVTTVRLAGGGQVDLAAATSLSAVVRKAAVVTVRCATPARLRHLPAAGTQIGRAGYWADGVRVGRVALVVAGGSASPSPSGGDASTAP